MNERKAYAACHLTQATYRSIQACKNFFWRSPSLPALSNSVASAWMKASGWPSVGTSR